MAIKKVLRLGFVVFGTLLVVTGIFKFLEVYHILGSLVVRQYWINLVHDWSGAIVVFLSVLGWILKKIKIPVTPSGNNDGKFLRVRGRVWLLLFLLTLAAAAGIYYIRVIMPQDRAIKQLESSQVREYLGQNLSSIADIQDNAINGTQNIDVNKYTLEISGLVQTPKSYTYGQVLNFQKYQKVVDLHCVESWNAKILWEGVLVKDLLASAGIKPQAKAVIFYASDGYTTSLPLDYIENNNILLAFKMNGVVIPPQKGFPFQLVAEQKLGYKWIKWLTRMELTDNVNYQGTWEKAGYSNSADVGGAKTSP